jgi:uncharacterized protein (DUF58 family)
LKEDQPVPTRQSGAVTIRPSSQLVRLAFWTAAGGLVAMAWPMLTHLVLACVGLAAVIVLADWVISRAGPIPQLQRSLPGRMVKGRSATVIYNLLWPDAFSTTASLLDELPADLGGDLIIEDIEFGPHQRREIGRAVIPAARGVREIGPTRILWRSRIGFLQFRATVLAGGSVAILPASVGGRRSGLTQRSLRDELGLRPRPARGEGMEFESLRDYFDGDDPRHLDWHATARRGRLMVRQYQTERRHTVIVALDTGRLMTAHVEAGSKLDHALDSAVMLARASREYGDRVGFIAFDRELRVLVRPRSGAACVGALIEATLNLTARPWEPNYRVLVETLAQYQKKRALVVVLTDFVEGSASSELESYLAVLARRHCVLLVALRDRLLGELDEREPGISRERLYYRLALQDLAVERAAALGRIRRCGAQTLDLDPAEVTVQLLNRYLAIRQAGLL